MVGRGCIETSSAVSVGRFSCFLGLLVLVLMGISCWVWLKGEGLGGFLDLDDCRCCRRFEEGWGNQRRVLRFWLLPEIKPSSGTNIRLLMELCLFE